MSSITEQFSAATKSQLEAHFKIFNMLASAAVDSAEKVIALNLSTTKASLEKSSAAAKQLLSARDPKEFFTLGTPQQGSLDGLLAYGRALYSIATSAQSQLIQRGQSTLTPVTAPAAANPAVASKPTPPALAAAVSAAVIAANEPIAVPKAPKAKPAAAPIPAQQEFIEVKAAIKPSFPAPPPKPITLAPPSKPAKAAPKAKK
jgi:phasin family protein